jgi:hypothetical protein
MRKAGSFRIRETGMDSEEAKACIRWLKDARNKIAREHDELLRDGSRVIMKISEAGELLAAPIRDGGAGGNWGLVRTIELENLYDIGFMNFHRADVVI